MRVSGILFVVLTVLVFEYSCENDPDLKSKKAALVKKHLKRLKKEEGAIKLVGGQDEYEGNLEILHDGRWGAVCDDEWDFWEATVVCKQLGYNGKVAKATNNSHFGISKRKYWMDDVYCNGTEVELTACRFGGWENSDCGPDEAAGVICIDKTQVDVEQHVQQRTALIRLGSPLNVRLVAGRIPEEGYVQVKTPLGPWQTVCGEGFSLLEALVVCRTLHFGYANFALQTNIFSGGGTLTNSSIFGLQCKGNEQDLSECYHEDIEGKCTTDNVAAVQCVRDMADLVIDQYEIIRTAYLEDRQMFFLQCAMEENCLASRAYKIQREENDWYLQTRRLLRFTARILNIGTADFRPFLPKHLWEWHMCHMHYHSMEVFATFDVHDSKGAKVAEGHKASFCLEDNQCLPGVEPRYACANFGDQGISVNCTDIYNHTVDCQWVDVTELQPGTYTLKVAVNPEFKVPEMSFENNAAVCQLFYTGFSVHISNCTLQRP